ncbi:MAG: D-TA family PLP-dependent enzyme [Planctomycetaceae bacterium]
MTSRYHIEDTSQILSPSIVLFKEIVEENIRKTIDMVGDPNRLRPHCKTHKMVEVAAMVTTAGITKQKCATFAEAEMLVQAGTTDIFLAYNIVGPNIERVVAFRKTYPDIAFSVTADHEKPIRELSAACVAAETSVNVLLDLDTDLHRTGIGMNDEAIRLYGLINEVPGLNVNGLHCYDGHHHQPAEEERRAGVDSLWSRVSNFRDKLIAADLPVPRIVAGGTPSFPMYARLDDPIVECSPGTCLLQDAGYGGNYADLNFTPAALLLTRCISRPTPNRVTFDLGTKAVASDPPKGHRVTFPDLPDAVAVLQNEEHLVLETTNADRFTPGDEILAIPTHICPSTALHKEVTVIADGKVTGTWPVIARDRKLNI